MPQLLIEKRQRLPPRIFAVGMKRSLQCWRTPLPCKPLPDATISADCGNAFPSSTSPAHYQWMAVETLYLHTIPNGYPWTHLGYTYNWAPGADRYGASEYIIRANAKGVIVNNEPLVRYCAPP